MEEEIFELLRLKKSNPKGVYFPLEVNGVWLMVFMSDYT